MKYKNKELITFVTHDVVDNVNTTVYDFLYIANQEIKHLITQKDIHFFNAKIEAFTKVIKHQFLLPQNLANKRQLETALGSDVLSYNMIRPKLYLQTNTPEKTFSGKLIALKSYKTQFKEHKILILSENQLLCLLCCT